MLIRQLLLLYSPFHQSCSKFQDLACTTESFALKLAIAYGSEGGDASLSGLAPIGWYHGHDPFSQDQRNSSRVRLVYDFV